MNKYQLEISVLCWGHRLILKTTKLAIFNLFCHKDGFLGGFCFAAAGKSSGQHDLRLTPTTYSRGISNSFGWAFMENAWKNKNKTPKTTEEEEGESNVLNKECRLLQRWQVPLYIWPNMKVEGPLSQEGCCGQCGHASTLCMGLRKACAY